MGSQVGPASGEELRRGTGASASVGGPGGPVGKQGWQRGKGADHRAWRARTGHAGCSPPLAMTTATRRGQWPPHWFTFEAPTDSSCGQCRLEP